MQPTPLAITADSLRIRVGRMLQLKAEGADGPVGWQTSDSLIASVNAGLVSGLQRGMVKVTATVGSRSADTTVTVTAPPTIALSAVEKSFVTTANGTVPDSQNVSITDGGDEATTGLVDSTPHYSSGASGWLSQTLTGTSAPATLSLQPSTSALPPGTYSATLAISSSTAVNTPSRLTVTYTIGPAPVIALGRSVVGFAAQMNGGAPDPQTVSITNGGGGTLTGLLPGTIAFANGNKAWLSASINPATAPATLTLTVTTTNLPVGTYNATVPVTSSTAGVAAVAVGVQYQVTSAPVPPSIVLSRSRVLFSAATNGSIPPAQAVNVSNGGSGSLTGLLDIVSFASGQPTNWLSAQLNTATAPAVLSLQPLSVLSPGSYTALVSVSSPVASNAPQVDTVTYVVSASPVISLEATTATFTAMSASVDPVPQMIGVSNTGGGSLTGLTASVAPSAAGNWLTAQVASAAPNAPSSTPLTLQVTTGDIDPGTYSATVTVSSTQPGVASQTVSVTFTRVATLAGDVQPRIFGVYCSSCHTGGRAVTPDGVDLSTADSSYASLINVGDPSSPSEVRVVPGDSAGSYLYHEVTNTVANPNDVMPPACLTESNTCLSPGLVHLIAVWIAQGAAKKPSP